MHCRAPRSGLCPEVGFDTTPGGRGDMFARMPCGWLWVPDLCGLALISVGASLLAMVECQSTVVLDVMASSRASSLPQGIWAVHGFCARQKSKCGSELARDGGVSVNDGVGCGGLIASKLAPTRDLRCTRILCTAEIQMWERACSRWRSVSQRWCWMWWPHREQARSHRDLG